MDQEARELARAARARALVEVGVLLAHQDGVVSRRQVLATGLAPYDIERMLRRREWAALGWGVYVDHTGPPTFRQRCWAVVLRYEPAVVAGHAAIRLVVPDWRHHRADAPITVQVDTTRHVTPARGVGVQRVADWRERVQPASRPPRLRIEDAAIQVALDAAREVDAIAVLADVCQTRRTTATRLRETLAARRPHPRDAFLDAVLADVEAGACSVLEHGYLTRVERAHGLPTAERQLPRTLPSGAVLVDCDYEPHPLRVELDGRLFHDNAAARDADLQRDLEAAVSAAGDGRTTVRVGYGQVYDRGCATAGLIGDLLRNLGWTGTPTSCDLCRTRAA